MKIEFRTFKNDKLLQIIDITYANSDLGFSKILEAIIIKGCRQLSIPIPLWLERNTHEFAAFHQTIFFADQFMEDTFFDRLQLRWLEDICD